LFPTIFIIGSHIFTKQAEMITIYFWVNKMLFLTDFKTEYFEDRIVAEIHSIFSEKLESVIKNGMWSFVFPT